MGALGGIPSGLLLGSDKLLGSLPAGGHQTPVKLALQRVRWARSTRANPCGLGGAGLQETQGPDPVTNVSPVCPHLPFCAMGAVLFQSHVLSLSVRGFKHELAAWPWANHISFQGPKVLLIGG